MKPNFYQPQRPVVGPAYSNWFKLLATAVTAALAVYCIQIALTFPLMQYSVWVKLLLLFGVIMLGVSYYWFLRSTVTIDERGITQTWLYDKQVEWRDVRSAKMIGVPYLAAVFPPRLIVRTGIAFTTFNGGSRELLIEFAKISLAYQMKK